MELKYTASPYIHPAVFSVSPIPVWHLCLRPADQELNLKLDNFYDEAYIMIRMNEGTPGNIEGGELTHITGNLYLLRAKEKSVKIEIR